MPTSSRANSRPDPSLVYRFKDGLYVNLTNRCPTRCVFCAKRGWKFQYRGNNLALGSKEPSAARVWLALEREAARGPFREMVFCGYGESTYRLAALTALSRRARKSFPRARLRLNTIGLGSLIAGRDICQTLAHALDAVSVSLNTADAAQWRRLHDPLPRFARLGFWASLAFISGCVAHGLDTTVTAVEQPEVDLGAVYRLARALGADFRARPALL